MEKINQVIDLIEHPEMYSEAQVNDILQDEECRQTYLTMMEVRMAFDKKNVEDNLDLDQAWQQVAGRQIHFSWRKMAASFVGLLLLSGVAFATIHTFSSHHEETHELLADTINVNRVAKPDTLKAQYQKKGEPEKMENFHKTFDNVALSDMLDEIAKHYGVKVDYRNQNAKQLRFYYEWDSKDELQKVLDELNHSQQVSLSLDNEAIVVE